MMVDKANAGFKKVIDPKGIGRAVPLIYTDTDKLPFVNITDKDFKRLQSEKSNQEKPDILMEETGILLFRQGGGLFNKLKNHQPYMIKACWGVGETLSRMPTKCTKKPVTLSKKIRI